METDLDVIVKNVAVRHGAGLIKSDAVMQLVTVMDSIIESHTTQLAEQQKVLLTSFREKLEVSCSASPRTRTPARKTPSTPSPHTRKVSSPK